MTVETNKGAPPPQEQTTGPGFEKSAVSSFQAFEEAQLAAAEAELKGEPVVEEAPEPESKPAEGAAEGAATPEGGEEGGEASEEGGEQSPTEVSPKPKPKARTSAKERIGELTRARGDAERRAEAAEERAREAEERAAALERGEKPPKTRTEAAPDAGGELVEPDPEKFEYGTLDPKYMAAVRAYDRAVIRQDVAAERQREAAEREASERATKFDDQVEALDGEVGDYVEVVVKGAQENKWACTSEMNELIRSSDSGAKIAYHLAKNPAESIKVSQMDPVALIKWFGRKEAELSAPPAQGKPKPAPVSKADPPADPVRGSGGKFKANAATTDFAAFERNHKHLLDQAW